MAAALPTTIKPTYNVDKTETARVLKNDFGDGYRQRVGDGINNVSKNYIMTWQSTPTNIKALITHFEERAGYQSFTWTPVGEVASYKWTCEQWSWKYIRKNVVTLTATFLQEFDL